jgi:predicted helicase
MQNELTQYIAELDRIYRAGNATEHTYRHALQRLLENITTGLTVTNEPRRIACGAPDYIVSRGEIPVGYIEAKDIGTDLNGKSNREQFNRYRQSLDNLIITDYLTFQLFEDGGLVFHATIGEINDKGIHPLANQLEAFAGLINLFIGYEGQWIQTSEHLSKIMAAKAKLMANIIEKALDGNEDGDNNSLCGQLQGFREILIPDITAKEFSDIYAQTIAYGMFAARLNDNTDETFTRNKAAQLIPQSNPFLQKLFRYIAGYELDRRICWVVDDLADLFNYVDTNEITKEFDKIEHDPIIHFYETFLAEYDPALRKSRGVWYTPQPVVRFIVQAVDDILKQHFDISQGLADTSKVKLKQYVKQKDGSLAEEQKEYHRVQILDPATGTGTFLSGVASRIYQRFQNQQGLWNGYVREHLIPRINGFEILMASYAMAHLKLDMLLQKTGYNPIGNSRLRIYLTNSLEEAHAKAEIPFAQWLSDEANEASRIKQDVPVMVVLGNPPYSVSSQNKGKWIQELMSDYKGGLDERNIQPLSDDYIKFIRYGQHFINKNGSGILAYISNNSFIDGLIHRKMRNSLMECFDTVYILNLHGNSKKKETAPDGSKDENVFDIQQGVSINIFVKARRDDSCGHPGYARVFHYDLYGRRQEKYNFLLGNSLETVKWMELQPQEPNYFLVPKDFSLQQEYEEGFKIDKLFIKASVGISTSKDSVNIWNNRNEVKQMISNIINLPEVEFRTKYNVGKDSRDWSIARAKSDVGNYIDENKILSINYRPFDVKFLYYTGKTNGIVARPRFRSFFCMLNHPNLGLVIPRQTTQEWKHVFISDKIIDGNFTSSARLFGAGELFPLYLYPETNKLFNDEKRKPNLNIEIVKEISQQTGLSFVEEKEDSNETSFAPIDLLDYIYAVLHSPAYRERYREFLKIDFPRVPYPMDAAQFHTLTALGAKLRRLHLMEGVEPSPDRAIYPKEGDNKVEKPTYESGKVWINDSQYFDNVPSEAWEFYIGGYQPAQKWIKDRKGRTLGYDDIRHYQRIIRVLKETGEVMKEVDETIKS